MTNATNPGNGGAGYDGIVIIEWWE
jgi:hypothetical protein